MKLTRLSIRAFRNLEAVEFKPCARFNIIHGANGQGKTNLLEAIYLLGTLKTFRQARNSDLVAWDAPHSIVRGWVERDNASREVALLLERGGKKARIDQKFVTRITDFFGSLNVVVFAPEELAMVKGAPDSRRRYLDRAVFSGDSSYVAMFHEYQRALRNRNALLKSGDRLGLEAWNEQLALAGARLVSHRLAYLSRIEELLRAYYQAIAGNDETVSLAYRPHRISLERLVLDARKEILSGLECAFDEERRLCTTVVGPHRDDLEFYLNGHLLKRHGSQGQQRSFILALKMAEIEFLRRTFTHPPILLLDDMTSELDQGRTGNLLEYLRHREMQVFITTTTPDTVGLQMSDDYTSFRVEKGKVFHEGNDVR